MTEIRETLPGTHLRSEWSNLKIDHSNESQQEYLSATSYYHVDLNNVAIKGPVTSTWTNISAAQSELGNLEAYNNIDLINSSAKDLHSMWGHVSVKNDGTPREVSTITAHDNVDLENVDVKGKVHSTWGRVMAKGSALDRVESYYDLSLTNCSAKDLESRWGKVTVKQTDGELRAVSSIQACDPIELDHVSVEGRVESVWKSVTASHSALADVKANEEIVLDNSSANHVQSAWGAVTVRQSDGTNRTITQIHAHYDVEVHHSTLKDVVCGQKAVITDSQLENLTLYMGRISEGLLDLTNTQVSGIITVKLPDFETVKSTENRFTLLIKASAMPGNIVFEGCDVTTEQTERGILVTGTKKV